MPYCCTCTHACHPANDTQHCAGESCAVLWQLSYLLGQNWYLLVRVAELLHERVYQLGGAIGFCAPLAQVRYMLAKA